MPAPSPERAVVGHITGSEDDGLAGMASVADHVLDHLAARQAGDRTSPGSPILRPKTTIELHGHRTPHWDLTVLAIAQPSASIDPAADGVDAIRIRDLRSIEEMEGIAERIDDEVKQDLVLVDLDGDYDSDDTFRLRSRICGGVSSSWSRGRAAPTSLRATASRVRRGGETLLGVLLVEPTACRPSAEPVPTSPPDRLR